MQEYKVLIRERLPVVPNFILAFGLVFSAQALYQSAFDAAAALFASAALFLFVSELRFMDELKDVEKDIVANPDRPLPRGAISRGKVAKLIYWTGMALLISTIVAAAVFSQLAGGLLSLAVLWLYLMYKEFYVGEWLSARPILYAISHQAVILPLCLFAVSLYAPEKAFALKSLGLGGLVLSGFFTFEVGRKLDPAAHPVLKTYLVEYGAIKTAIFIAVLQVLALLSAWTMGAFWWVAPFAILILLSLPKLMRKPDDFKKLEGLIALNLIYVVWVAALQHLAGKL